MKLAHLSAKVYGHVHGVNFRSFTANRARFLELKGYVRNIFKDGVEVEVEGDKAQLQEFIEMLKRGPSRANVTRVETRWTAYTGKFSGFETKPARK